MKDTSRWEVLEAIAESLARVGLAVHLPRGDGAAPHDAATPSAVAIVLNGHAVAWDRLRSLLLPRMPRVYPSSLPHLWRAYLRLLTIDLGLRVGALLRHAGADEGSLAFLEWALVSRRGGYLNRLREEAGIRVLRFPDEVGVAKNTAEGWLYEGALPGDGNLRKIGKALASRKSDGDAARTTRDLRLLYWVSEVAAVLAEHVGEEVVADLLQRFHRYAIQVYRIAAGEDAESVAARRSPRPYAPWRRISARPSPFGGPLRRGGRRGVAGRPAGCRLELGRPGPGGQPPAPPVGG